MVAMATWEDGPEYAPLTRPDAFSEPSAPPLSIAPPHEQVAAVAPTERPAFSDPPEPVAPLASLVPPVEKRRDPAVPFEVVSTAMTSVDSAWSAAHWTPPPAPPAGPLVGAASELTAAAAPTGAPWPPAPTQPLHPAQGPAPSPQGFPTPGTAEWFTPAPYRQPVAPAPVNAKLVLETLTPGVGICLVIGGLVALISPIMLAVAFGLSSRIRVATSQIRRTFITALTVMGVFAALGALTDATSFGDWWSFVGIWSLVICWATLLVVVVLVHSDLKRLANGDQSAPRSPWS
jgi:hypothetical protein